MFTSANVQEDRVLERSRVRVWRARRALLAEVLIIRLGLATSSGWKLRTRVTTAFLMGESRRGEDENPKFEGF
jgi:hypothetical protein